MGTIALYEMVMNECFEVYLMCSNRFAPREKASSCIPH